MRAGNGRWSPIGGIGRRHLAALGAIFAMTLLYLTGAGDFVWNRDVGREKVEDEARTALLYEGVTVADVSCPHGLERETGASVVCSYTDFNLNIDETLARPRTPRPPRKGRVEIRIRGLETRAWGTRHPEFEARVVEPARRPGPR